MISVSIVNVTSYTGLELLRLLAQHPHFILTSVTARSAVGKRLDEVFPQLTGRPNVGDKEHISLDPGLVITEEPAWTDLAFVCLPHAAAAQSVLTLLERGTRVVDLSADFRLHDAALYEEWYKHVHPAPALLETAVYGLCERYRERIEGATVAPGSQWALGSDQPPLISCPLRSSGGDACGGERAADPPHCPGIDSEPVLAMTRTPGRPRAATGRCSNGQRNATDEI